MVNYTAQKKIDKIMSDLFAFRCQKHKISDTRKFAVITLKVEQDGFSLE